MLIVLTGMLTAVACETLCCLMLKRRPTILDGSAAVIGGLIGALMPPAAPYWLSLIHIYFCETYQFNIRKLEYLCGYYTSK